MGTLTLHPDNEEQMNIFKALAKALKVKFETSVEEKPYNPEFVEMILQGEKDYAEGKFTRVEHKDLKKFLGL